ncbi:enolase [Nematocida parisii]|nr:enolase [Nematocida parisii]KAI5128581.1 enolase [Nematocida parisii]KAI5141879.1 enolase [Nematocida parisii]
MKIKKCIQKVIGRSIFDSRGIPTVEVDFKTTIGTVRASCPSGASTGSQEALELRDGDSSNCMGKSVQKALIGVEELANSLISTGMHITDQEAIDKHMIELDGTKNKSRVGANSILPMSICFARLGAKYMQMQEWVYLQSLMQRSDMKSCASCSSTAPNLKCALINSQGSKHLPNGSVLVSNTEIDSELKESTKKKEESDEKEKNKDEKKPNDSEQNEKDEEGSEQSKKVKEDLESEKKKADEKKDPELEKKEADERKAKEEDADKKPKQKEKLKTEKTCKDALLKKKQKPTIPRIFFNIINGGRHADNGLFVQEIMVSFDGNTPYNVLTSASEFIWALKSIVKKKYKLTGVGDEGGFAPPISSLEEGLDLIQEAAKASGITPSIALDVAASEFYKDGKYNIGWKTKDKYVSRFEMIDYYVKIINKYKVAMIEDPFDEKDYEGWEVFMKEANTLGTKVVGDDLIVTNPELIKKAGEEKLCNVALIKMNQIGTITETIQAVKEARKQGMKVMASHRSGETEDIFLAHLAVGLSADYLKAGSLCRTERVSKYNELVRIFEKFSIDTI